MMGGTGNTNPTYYSSSKSLNYARGSNSLINATSTPITAIPQIINFQDSVGLFGSENVFIKIDLNILNSLTGYGEEELAINGYLNAVLGGADDSDIYYEKVVTDYTRDLVIENTYEPAVMSNKIEKISQPLISVEVENLKTGNKYIDAWFDVRIYTKDRMEYQYDKMYISPTSFFYIGFHARNTKRLPYNVRMTVGDGYTSIYNIPASERRYIVS
jgi:hypothetical protein